MRTAFVVTKIAFRSYYYLVNDIILIGKQSSADLSGLMGDFQYLELELDQPL